MLARISEIFGHSETAFPRAVPGLGVAALLIALLLAAAGARAQDLEPRSYSNAPVGMNFLIAAYGYAYGDIAFDPTLPIVDAQYRQNSGAVAYARSLDVWGKSAKFDVVLPYSSFSGHALVSGQTRERAMSGWNDPRFRFSMNFYGAPALSLKEFAGYRQDLIVGASLQVMAPLGQYDDSKLINLGNNRWSFKPELGVSKAWGRWTVEIAPSVTLYTDNTDFNKGSRLAQAPLYAVQGHLIYGFPSGIWMAFNGTYFKGNRTTVNGVQSDNLQENTRAGLTFALPVDRSNSVKFHASTGATTRTGTEFTVFGIAWQYRWGGGF
jgi:hypothetical protein